MYPVTKGRWPLPFVFSYASPVTTQCYKLYSMGKNMGDKPESQHSHRETASCYHTLIPCVVIERKFWNTKEDKGKSMMYIVCTVVGEIAHSRTK